MTGFRKGTPPTEGRHMVLIQWRKGCNVHDFDYTLDLLYFINGSWYKFEDGADGMPCTTIDGGTDYTIVGWYDCVNTEAEEKQI